jgi:hypothetical protein
VPPELTVGADPYEVMRAAERLADRLRMLGPRWAARGNAADAAPVAAVRDVLQRLADLAARAEGEPCRPVPDIGLHALADQLLVLARDATAAGDPATLDEAARTVDELRSSL